MSINPYEAPQTFDAPNIRLEDPEVIRKTHINTEASLKSIGGLSLLGGIFLLIAGITSFADVEKIKKMTSLAERLAAVSFPVIGIILFVVGTAVRKLKPWSRIGVGILSGIGLLAFPIGTLISAYILVVAFGKKGRMIFSRRYKEVILATPHVKCRTSNALWIILGLFVLALVIGATARVLSRQ